MTVTAGNTWIRQMGAAFDKHSAKYCTTSPHIYLLLLIYLLILILILLYLLILILIYLLILILILILGRISYALRVAGLEAVTPILRSGGG